MKTLKIGLCLFLCLQNPRIDSLEQEIYQYEQKAMIVDKKEASLVSKQISNLQQKLLEQSLLIQKQLKKRTKEKKTVYISRLERAKKQWKSYQLRLSSCQEELEKRFSDDYSTYKEGGHPSDEGLILGNEDLPSFGGYISLQKEKRACPEFNIENLESFSSSWQSIVPNGFISAGTWQYPSGGLHLGLDIATPLFSPIYAPANGIILYAHAPVSSNNGYLGNYCGWPLGGGNTIATIMAVGNQLYGVTFAHLSNQLCVKAGQSVSQGTILAYSGNSGNSTGPHVHIEIFTINTDLESAVNYFRKNADFTFGNGFSVPATCSAIACRIRPESVL